MIALPMETIDRIPVTLDPAETAARLRLDPARAAAASLDELIGLARGLLAPRAAAATACVGTTGEGTVELDGVVFRSAILRKNLDRVHKVFPYIITVGPELELAAAAQGDLLRQYCLEEMANAVLDQAAAWLARHLEDRHGVRGLASLSPGSLADWPITEQPKLFSLFGDTERIVGVRLTESLLMVPRKSVSGIFFPSEEGFTACRFCDRERCPGRKAPRPGPPAGGRTSAVSGPPQRSQHPTGTHSTCYKEST